MGLIAIICVRRRRTALRRVRFVIYRVIRAAVGIRIFSIASTGDALDYPI